MPLTCTCQCCINFTEEKQYYILELQKNYDQLRILAQERDHYRQQTLQLAQTPKCLRCDELFDDVSLLREKLITKNEEIRTYSNQLDAAVSELSRFRDELNRVNAETALPFLTNCSSTLSRLHSQVQSLESWLTKSTNDTAVMKTLSRIGKELGGVGDVVSWCADTISQLLGVEQDTMGNQMGEDQNQDQNDDVINSHDNEISDDDVIRQEIRRLSTAFKENSLEFPLISRKDGYYLSDRKIHLIVKRNSPKTSERVLVRSGGGFVSLAEFLKNTRIFRKK
ncbi:hypothetical protein P9112_009692 [Eukaryota sp. TZLM1-RC]